MPGELHLNRDVKSLPTDDLGMTSTGQKKKLWVTKFDIDIGKCCYCGLCVYPCPTECIKMTDVYEFSEYKRHDLIYNFSTLTEGEISDIKAKAAEMEKEAAAKKAAAAAAAAKAKAEAPSADQPCSAASSYSPCSSSGPCSAAAATPPVPAPPPPTAPAGPAKPTTENPS